MSITKQQIKMRMSCNGCRVLRKGCNDNCSIRPCLDWIKTPQSQANATVFLAKFYGRAGLLNLINAGPQHLRPAIFRSLLYEACGRIVNPIYGSVGLLWSGNWQQCQQAVEAVLKGSPIAQIPTESAAAPPLKACDIRHVTRPNPTNSSSSAQLHKVTKSKSKFKRSAEPKCDRVESRRRAPSHESSVGSGREASRGEEEEVSHVSQGEAARGSEESEVELELTLGFEHVVRSEKRSEKLSDLFKLCDGMDLGLS